MINDTFLEENCLPEMSVKIPTHKYQKALSAKNNFGQLETSYMK